MQGDLSTREDNRTVGISGQHPLEGTTPHESNGRLQRVTPAQDVNGPGSGSTILDERRALQPGGTLWRVNPTSARGMKQGLRTVRGVNRSEVEKTCKRDVLGEASPGRVDSNCCALKGT